MVCANCGAPLPQSVAVSPFVLCSYCGATSHVEDGSVTQRAPLPAEASERLAEDDIYSARLRSLSAFRKALEAHSGALIDYARFRDLCEQNLQLLGQTDTVARVAYNLA